MAEIHLTPGLTLLEAFQVAQDAGMYLVSDGREVRVSPIILPGWYQVPLRIKVTAPERGRIDLSQQVAA